MKLNLRKCCQAFEKAMALRFSMIDVNKSIRMSQSKNAEDKLKLVNELKIITASEHIYSLWEQVISAATHGELINPDTCEKFNEKENWNPGSCLLSRENFKWLGNLTLNDLERLAKHLLNQSGKERRFPYPKVTIKSISSVLQSCYSTKDWVERRKRKQLVKKELNNIDPSLGLINAEGELVHAKWKEFKASRHITSASMNVLLERPGEAYFAAAKQLKSKNKTCAQISPAAAEFFRAFLNHKFGFQKPYASADYRTYNVQKNSFSDWNPGAWQRDSSQNIGLGVLDLREIPGGQDRTLEAGRHPYFYHVLAALEDKRSPLLGEVKRWLVISGSDSHERQQAMDFPNYHGWFKVLHCDFADYIPAKFERLGDVSIAKAPKKVILQFFQDLTDPEHVDIPDAFEAPNTPVFTKPHGYNELEFRVYQTELRMEFYLWLVRRFCKPGEAVFSIWGGGKLSCAAVISSINVYAVGGDAEADRWQDVSSMALSLDRDDFLPTGYRVRAKLKNPANTPARERGSTRRSDRGRDSPAKRQRTENVVNLDGSADEEDDSEDEENEGYDSDFVPNSERVEVEEDDYMEEDLPEFATPTGPRSASGSQSARPSRPPSPIGTPVASSSGGRRTRKKDGVDSMASMMGTLKDILADNQRKTDLQIAELQARQDRDREESRRIQEETSNIMKQQQQSQNLLLDFLMRMTPTVGPAPTNAPPMLRDVAGSSSGHVGGVPLPQSTADVPMSPDAVPSPLPEPKSPLPSIAVVLDHEPSVVPSTVPPQSSQRNEDVEETPLQVDEENDHLAFSEQAAGFDT